MLLPLHLLHVPFDLVGFLIELGFLIDVDYNTKLYTVHDK